MFADSCDRRRRGLVGADWGPYKQAAANSSDAHKRHAFAARASIGSVRLAPAQGDLTYLFRDRQPPVIHPVFRRVWHQALEAQPRHC